MSTSVQNTLAASDLERVIRFIHGAPLCVRVGQDEGITHDIERFCAFRQAAFHETERACDKAMMFIQSARDAQNRLLEGIDKYAPSSFRIYGLGL
jgi:hypothetical protein